MKKRYTTVIVSNCFLALAIAMLNVSNTGNDPYTLFNFGLSYHLPTDFATTILIVNCLLFIPCFIVKRDCFGLGAFINMFVLGYIVQFHLWWMSKLSLTNETILPFWAKAAFLIVGVLLVCVSVAFYMECNLGAAPYDVLGDVVEKLSKQKIKYRYVRIITDICCMIVGTLLGGTLAAGTIITAFFTGPLVSYFREKYAKKFMAK